jgi:hypothetical protein
VNSFQGAVIRSAAGLTVLSPPKVTHAEFRDKLNDPNGQAVGAPGIVYVADLFNARICAVHYDDSEH